MYLTMTATQIIVLFVFLAADTIVFFAKSY